MSKMPPKSAGDRKSVSKSERAGLVFPVAKEFKSLRSAWRGRVAANAPVYLAGVLEAVAAEVVQAAGDATKKAGAKRITPAHLSAGIRNDLELHKALGGAVVFAGDKVSGITAAITHDLDKKKADKKKSEAAAAK